MLQFWLQHFCMQFSLVLLWWHFLSIQNFHIQLRKIIWKFCTHTTEQLLWKLYKGKFLFLRASTVSKIQNTESLHDRSLCKDGLIKICQANYLFKCWLLRCLSVTDAIVVTCSDVGRLLFSLIAWFHMWAGQWETVTLTTSSTPLCTGPTAADSWNALNNKWVQRFQTDWACGWITHACVCCKCVSTETHTRDESWRRNKFLQSYMDNYSVLSTDVLKLFQKCFLICTCRTAAPQCRS